MCWWNLLNDSDKRVWIDSPALVKGDQAVTEAAASRALPDLYRQIPRTMEKLTTGQPVTILTLGSSIDRGSANPRLYFYAEDPDSPHYKEPLVEARPGKPDAMKQLIAERMGRPDLQDYVAGRNIILCIPDGCDGNCCGSFIIRLTRFC